MRKIFDQKGFAPILIIAGVAVLAIAAVAVWKLTSPQPTQVTQSTAVNNNTTPAGSTRPPQSSNNPQATQSATATNCDLAHNVCFESTDMKVKLQEGYLEDQDKWIAHGIKLKGNGQVCYTLTLSADLAKNVSIPKGQDCYTGSSQTVDIRVQKNVIKNGTFTGTLTLKSNSVTQTAKLEVDFVPWDKSAIHTDPDKLVINTKVIGDPSARWDWPYTQPFKFYYLGNHTVDIKTTHNQTDGVVGKFTFNGGPDYVDMHDTALVAVDYTKWVANFAVGKYTGYFQFLDHSTKEELYRMPYELNVTAN